MNLSQLLPLSAAVILIGVGLIVETYKMLALRRHMLEPFEAVSMDVICVGFLGVASAMFAAFLV